MLKEAKAYSDKLVDMWTHRGSREYEFDDIMLLKVGRHLRPRPHFKLIIAREEGETRFLEGYRKQFVHLQCKSHSGPLVMIDGEVGDEDKLLAAQISARFGQGREAEAVEMEITDLQGVVQVLTVKPMPASAIPQDWYV